MQMGPEFWSAITRKKSPNHGETTGNLARVLSLLDLISFGTGGTLGLGVYVLAGSVAKNYAGPATCLSFLLAALVSLLAGLCFVEFAARVPRTGYSYAYCYAGIGELVAFLEGWNLLLGGVLGVASVTSGMSSYLDTLFEKQISSFFANLFPINVPCMTPSPDFVALTIIVLLTILLAVGTKESSMFNKICTLFNLLTIIITVIACSTKADIKNWRISKKDIPQQYRDTAGDGGFLPYGFAGLIAGIPNCFFGFTGFDSTATCSDEAKNPKRDIPLSIIITLLLVFVVYFTLSTVLTLVWPYYLQSEDASFSYLFDQLGWKELKWVVTIGAVFALSSSVFGSMYFVIRIFYVMADDGLIFKCLAKIHPATKTPLVSTILSGVISGLMGTFLKLNSLMDLMTIGSFFSYGIVAMSVIVLRYENTTAMVSSKDEHPNDVSYFRIVFNIDKNEIPSKTTSTIVNISIFAFTLVCSIFCFFVINSSIFNNKYLQYMICSFAGLVMIIIVLIIFRQPESTAKIAFRVPLVPFIPCLSIIFNVFLMMQLNLFTWIGFLSWAVIGIVMYLFYGIKHSKENKNAK